MKVSIVIPAYNAGAFLTHTLNSVAAQSFTDWEAVVVNDGSRDDTEQVARGFADADARFRVVTQSNAGVAEARNRGYAEIGSDSAFVAFLDHDDIWHKDALRVLTQNLDGHPEMPGVHGLARRVDADGAPLGAGEDAIQNFNRRMLSLGTVVTAGRAQPTSAAMVVYDNLICTPGQALVRRKAIDAILQPAAAPFDPAAVPLDDWDFWLRITRLGDLAFVDAVVIDWRRHDAAGSHDTRRMSAAGMRIRKRLVAGDLPADLRETAEWRYARLVVTEKRREARDQWRESLSAFGNGRFRQGAALCASAAGRYAQYLSLRVRPQKVRRTP